MVRESKELLRDKDNFLRDLSKTFQESGIQENSLLNEMPDGYHVTRNKVGDILHDFLEGICGYDMSRILHHLVIKTEKVSLDTLNFKLRTFDYYSNNLRNEVPHISREHLKSLHLRTSGSEMLTLVRILGVVIGNLVDQYNPAWKLYLLLRRILDLILAPIIQPQCSVILEQLICEHHELFLELFPNEHLRPKFHFAVHYPGMLPLVGPLSHLWCMRLEAKHRDVTTVADSTESRKNIAYTVALRQQLLFSDRLLRGHGLKDSLEMPVVPSCKVTDLTDYESFSTKIPCDRDYFVPSWIEFNGIKYQLGMCVVTGSNDLSEPQFGIIQNILVDDRETVYLVCKLLDIVRFDVHIHGFEVTVDDDWCCVEIKKLFTPHPVIIATLPSGRCIVTLKYAL